MDIRQLKYFIGIADCGSLSQAALQLHVVQSALSHTLSQLEEELHTELVRRKPRGVEITESGQVLYNYAQTILSTLDQAKYEILAARSPVRRRIWIGFSYSALSMVLPMLPTELIAKYPQIGFGIVEDLSSTLVEYLTEGKADLVLVYNPPNEVTFSSRPIFEEPVCCVGLPDILGNDRTPITFDEVLRLPLILPGKGAMLRGVVRRADQYKRLEAACAIEIHSRTAMISGMRSGLGCALLSEATVANELRNGTLVARLITEPGIKRELHVVRSALSVQDPILESISQLIQGYIQADVAKNPIEGRNTI